MSKISSGARSALLRTTGIAGILSAALSNAALAQSATYTFNIPAEPLSLALQDVAKTSGKQIMFADRLTAGKSTEGLHGVYTVNVAMGRLLTGTDLAVSETNSGGIVVKPKNVQAAANDTGAAANEAQPNSSPIPVESVVVTGSRVISDIANSPTPITAVSTNELLKTTPIDIPNALNKLPVFAGSSTPSDPVNSSNGIVGNVLNLRNFGAQRTLVLLDGHRQAPSNANGTIDIDTLPQTLMQRVDVVTGGASAVYGSDAVTGVVNFVLDKKFEGIKVEGNAGISNYTDGAEQQLSLAAGTSLFGGRGHWEGSLRYYHLDPILLSTRPWGTPTRWVGVGSGTAAHPVQNVEFGTYNNFAFGGKVTCAGCAANGEQFVSNGVLGPFVLGAPTSSSTITSRGDGTYNQASDLQYGAVTYQAFSRFSYDVSDNVTAYVQVLGAQGSSNAYHVNNYIQSASTVPNQIFATNAFLSPAAQAALANPSGVFTDTQYFEFPYYNAYRQYNTNRNLSVAAGLDGTLLDKFDWDLYYSHSEDRLDFNSPDDESNAKIAAANDAVVNPANGQIVCEVSLTAYASLYPGCVPLNRFGPTAATPTEYNYILADEQAITTQRQEDLSGSISGPVFDLPAGPVKAALSGEYRRLSFKVASNALPGTVDCTGLRLCPANMPQTMHGITLGRSTVSDSVWEFAGELDAPLLKDMPLVQSLDLDLAGRYTDYSISGAVQTWKIGLDYHVNDDVHFRGTTSVDIRAPTLFDLYAPVNLGKTGFTDPHTGNQSQQVITQSQGNPNLVPEVARTYTGGVVVTPSFIPRLQLSVDYYQITLQNAISTISGTTGGVAQACESSGGTSPLCSLFVRPLPFSNTSQANFPTLVLSETLNAARASTGGFDMEADYNFDLGDVVETLPGNVDFRSFFTLQPYNKTATFPGAPIQTIPEAKGRVTTFISYSLNDWRFDIGDRFYSAYDRSSSPGTLFYAQETGEARNYVDLTVSKTFTTDGNDTEVYLNVQNLFNLAPPIEPSNFAVPGSSANGLNGTGAGYSGVDTVGRYFTIGFRARY